MSKTSIEWTDFSVSPIRARAKASGKVFHFCERVSSGCANCYAARMAQRFGLPDYVKANRDKVEFFLDNSRLASVLRRKKPTRYFWEDCSDLFGDWVPVEWLDYCFAAMALTARHTHQVLTKRPARAREYLVSRSGRGGLQALERAARAMGYTMEFEGRPLVNWPLPNVWLGISAENQAVSHPRIWELLQIPAAVRFVSAEPLLGPLDLGLDAWFHAAYDRSRPASELAGARPTRELLHWVIVGGESGAHRPCHLKHVRDVVQQCAANGVACFVKQLGACPVMDEAEWKALERKPLLAARNAEYAPAGTVPIALADRKGGNPDEWPEDLRVRQWPGRGRALPAPTA